MAEGAERIPDVSRHVVRRAEGIVAEVGIDGRVTVRRRRFGAVRARMAAMAGVPADLTVRLDPIGSAAWHLVDGRRSVAEIRAELERAHPAEGDMGPRLGKFLGTMVSNGMLDLA